MPSAVKPRRRPPPSRNNHEATGLGPPYSSYPESLSLVPIRGQDFVCSVFLRQDHGLPVQTPDASFAMCARRERFPTRMPLPPR
jgi:hypothetical protein